MAQASFLGCDLLRLSLTESGLPTQLALLAFEVTQRATRLLQRLAELLLCVVGLFAAAVCVLVSALGGLGSLVNRGRGQLVLGPLGRAATSPGLLLGDRW